MTGANGESASERRRTMGGGERAKRVKGERERWGERRMTYSELRSLTGGDLSEG